MRLACAIGMALLLTAAASLPAVGQTVRSDPLSPEQRAWVQDHGPILVAVQRNAEPATVVLDGNVTGGWGVDVLQAIALKVGADLEFQLADDPREMVALLAEGKVDAAGVLGETPGLAFAGRTTPAGWVPTVFVTHVGHGQLRDPSDLVSGRVSTLAGSPLESMLAREYPQLEYVPTPNTPAALRLLADQKLDLYLGSLPAIGHQLQEQSLAGIRPVGNAVHTVEMSYWAEEGSMVLAVLEAGRQRISAAELSVIHVKWTAFDLGPPEEPQAVPFIPVWLRWTLLGLLVVSLMLIGGNTVLRREVQRRTQALSRSEAFLVTVLDASPNAIYVRSWEGRYRIANTALASMLGVPQEKIAGSTDLELGLPAELAARRLAEDQSAMRGHQTTVLPEREVVVPGKGPRWLVQLKVPLGAYDAVAGHHLEVMTVAVDVTEQRRLREGLEDQVADRTAVLQTANEDLKAFVSSASHDLRTPLLLLRLQGQRLQRNRKFDPTTLQEMLDVINQMERMLDSLLAFSRAGSHAIQWQEVDLSATSHSLVEQLRRTEPERDVEVHIEDGLHAQGDPFLLRVAIGNLLANAWKYTANAEQARISVESGPGGATLCVRDNGIGFDEEEADSIWRPFSRLHAAEGFAGSGIGLATVKRIIERHGGRVAAHGTPGEGARICVWLDATGPGAVNAAPVARSRGEP